MKIIREGAVPMPPPRWPVGAEFECLHCHARFEIEAGDPFRQVTEKCIDGRSTMTIPCPTCDTQVTGERPRTSGDGGLFLRTDLRDTDGGTTHQV